MSNELIDKITEQNEAVRKMKLEELESEHNYILEQMIDSRDKYTEFYGYYFSLVVELYSRYVLEDAKNGNKSNFNRSAEYRYSLQKKFEEE